MSKKFEDDRDRPLPLAVAMAADDQDLGVVPVDRLADHAPGVSLDGFVADVGHLLQLALFLLGHRSVQLGSVRAVTATTTYLGAEALGPVHDPGGGALEVGLDGRQELGRADAGDADDGGRGRLGGEHGEAVLLRLPRREEVLQRPLQRVVAVVAVVDPHHHHRLPRRRSTSSRRRLRRRRHVT